MADCSIAHPPFTNKSRLAAQVDASAASSFHQDHTDLKAACRIFKKWILQVPLIFCLLKKQKRIRVAAQKYLSSALIRLSSEMDEEFLQFGFLSNKPSYWIPSCSFNSCSPTDLYTASELLMAPSSMFDSTFL